jgi:transcriptional regulator with GAF, ATPase, and Fis domain
MVEFPTREHLASLSAALRPALPVSALGFVQQMPDGRVAVFYSTRDGLGRHIVPPNEAPPALLPSTTDVAQIDADTLAANREQAIAWHLSFVRVSRVLAARVPGFETPTRFWVGLGDPRAPTGDGLRLFEDVAASSAGALQASLSPDEAMKRLQRLERAAGLLPTLRRVLDVREVFESLSATSQQALPHDSLTLALVNDELTHLTLYATTADGPLKMREFVQPYPAAFLRAWDFDILDDREQHPIEAGRPGIGPGTRSSLRLSIRFDDRVIAGIGFNSIEPHRFDLADLDIARRLADFVGMSLSHYQLVEQARRSAALRERAANLETLDELLATLTDVLDVRQVFDRVSAISDRVLPHDALSIAEVVEDGVKVRIHASHGLGDLPEPLDIPTPEPWMHDEPWEFRLIDDVQEHPEYARGPGWAAGMRSMMFLAIRLEGKLFGGLNFYSKTPGRYTKDDVLIGRRITDHVALALSHRRLAEQAQRNEELRARQTNLELLDALLVALIDTGDLREVFERLSTMIAKVLPHDGAVLMVRLPDGIHARLYASTGIEGPLPEQTRVPEELLRNPNWEFDIIDDLPNAGPQYERGARLGFKALLRVPIRLDGKFAGAFVLFTRTDGGFQHADSLVARRVADRLALTLARERRLEESKRADEETERASRLEARVRALTEELDARTGYRRVVGESLEWRQALTQATQVAPTEATVLLLGESGTGKEVVARFIHRASSRNGGPFIALNCAALPEQLLEAELFGYERGAFTGAMQSKPGQLEQASGGTLFLDEVAEMSPSAQAKFLRVLQEREFQRLGGTRMLRTDARVLAATNRDLLRAISQNQFREDLYYRLNVFAIKLPPLRARRDDILSLSEAFLVEIGRGLGRPPAGISRDARQLLVDYHWPGNVRELRNILERAAILCDGGLITANHLALNVIAPPPPATPPPPARPATAPAEPAAMPAQPSSAADLQSMERAMIEQALKTAKFNKSKAAKALGLTRHQLYMRLKKYGFEE